MTNTEHTADGTVGVAPGAIRNAASAAPASAVSWGAILAGAAGAAALSLILLILGVGLGLSSVSPWSGSGIGVAAFGVSTIVWLTFTQLAASGMGGYLAGRLRTRWTAVQADEVYFRDTAHGFLAWAVASLATAALLGGAISGIVGSGVQAGAGVVGGAATTAAAAVGGAAAGGSGAADASGRSGSSPVDYYVDMLFRRGPTTASAATPESAASGVMDAASGAAGTPSPSTPMAAAATTMPSASGIAPPTAEVVRIVSNALRAGSLSPDDTRYLGQLVAQRTNLAPADAERRVTDTFGRVQTAVREAQAAAQEAADKARKATAAGSLWLFVSMLIGAFVASWAATFGGRQRDF